MSHQPPIFRHIEIARQRQIFLGEPFEFAACSVLLGPDEHELRPSEFGGAESIVLELSPDGIVRAMRFRYTPRASFEGMVRGYKDMLGAPASEQPDRVEWSDARTSFALWLDASRREAVLHSRLADRGADR